MSFPFLEECAPTVLAGTHCWSLFSQDAMYRDHCCVSNTGGPARGGGLFTDTSLRGGGIFTWAYSCGGGLFCEDLTNKKRTHVCFNGERAKLEPNVFFFDETISTESYRSCQK